MIRISSAQLKTYQDQLDERLSKKILAFLKEECADSLNRLNDPMILHIIDGGIRKASQYELSSEYAITSFISLMIEVGFVFDKQPHIQKILRITYLDDNQRINLLVRAVTEQEWQEASMLVDSE